MISILSFLICTVTLLISYTYIILLVLNQIILNAPKFIPGKKVFATWITQVNHFCIAATHQHSTFEESSTCTTKRLNLCINLKHFPSSHSYAVLNRVGVVVVRYSGTREKVPASSFLLVYMRYVSLIIPPSRSIRRHNTFPFPSCCWGFQKKQNVYRTHNRCHPVTAGVTGVPGVPGVHRLAAYQEIVSQAVAFTCRH